MFASAPLGPQSQGPPCALKEGGRKQLPGLSFHSRDVLAFLSVGGKAALLYPPGVLGQGEPSERQAEMGSLESQLEGTRAKRGDLGWITSGCLVTNQRRAHRTYKTSHHQLARSASS